MERVRSTEDCNKLKKDDLVGIARSLNIAVSGTKSELCERIVKAVQKEMQGQLLITGLPKFAYKAPVFKPRDEGKKQEYKQQKLQDYFKKQY
jgi:hypothetical protein